MLWCRAAHGQEAFTKMFSIFARKHWLRKQNIKIKHQNMTSTNETKLEKRTQQGFLSQCLSVLIPCFWYIRKSLSPDLCSGCISSFPEVDQSTKCLLSKRQIIWQNSFPVPKVFECPSRLSVTVDQNHQQKLPCLSKTKKNILIMKSIRMQHFSHN